MQRVRVMRERRNRRAHGRYCRFITRDQGTFIKCITRKRRSQGNCMNFVCERATQMPISLPNGRSKVMRNCAVCCAYSHVNINLVQLVSVVCPRVNWMITKPSNVIIVVAGDVPVQIDAMNLNLYHSNISYIDRYIFIYLYLYLYAYVYIYIYMWK
jgi:hypothetical protein